MGSPGGTALAARRPPGHEPRWADDALIVAFRPGTTSRRVERALGAIGGQSVRTYATGARLVHVARGSVERSLTRLREDPAVRYAEPDYVVTLQREPDDPSLDQLWGLLNEGQPVNGTTGSADADIDAEIAWDVTTGSRSIVVGVVDTGVDQDHPDLAANLWANPGGVAGCPAGTHGFDAVGNDCDPEDDQDHGSHVSGTIGAVGDNGRGVVGVNWTTSIMAIKAFNAAGEATDSTILGALDFAIRARDAGVALRVINASWGGFDYSRATAEAIDRLGDRDVLFVTAAGNYGFPNDWFGFYPCGYDVPTIVCVAASDQSDDLAWFSNYGVESVDLAAPGVNVLSTVRGGGYRLADGTSMATPHVVGAAALVLSRRDIPALELRDTLLATVDHLPALDGWVATGGRLNVANALATVSPLPGAPALSGTAEAGVLHLAWTEPLAGDAAIESYRLYRGEGGSEPAFLVELPASVRTYDDSAVTNEVAYTYRVSAVSSLGEGPLSAPVTLTPPAPPTAPDAPALSALADDGAVHLCWIAPFDGRSPITGYRVYRSPDGGSEEQLATVGPGAVRYDDAAVANGVPYAYRLSAENAVGEGPASSVASTTPGPGTEPSISGLSPAIVAQGGALTISGANFATGACPNNVVFDTRPGTVSSATSTEVGAIVPSAGGWGPVTVTTPSGSAVSPADLFVVPPPNTPAEVGWTGRLAAGTGKLVSLPSAGQVGLALFSGAAGDRVSLNVTGVSITQSDISILKPDGGTLATPRYVTTSGTFFDTMTLAGAGTYLVRIDPRSSYTGNATLTLYSVPPDATTVVPMNGSATLTTTVPGQNGFATFSASAGQRVSINVTNVTVGQSDISILKPDGSTLVAPRYVLTGGTFFDTMTLPSSGDYRIVVNPRLALVGGLRLSLYEVPADATATATIGGPATTLTTTVPGQNAGLLFEGSTGQRMSMLAGNVTIAQSDVSILKPDGATLVPARYVTGTNFFDTVTLPATGTYRVVLNPRSAFTGSMTFTLYAVPADVSAPITVGGSAVTLTTTVPGQNGAATFTGTAGQRVSLEITGVTVACDVSIRKPDGSNLVAPRYIVGTNFIDTVTLPVGGTYTIVFDPRVQGTGSVTLRLYDVPPDPTVSLTIGGPAVTVTTTVPGQNARATFSGSAGTAISLVLSGVTIAQSDVSILKPDGSTLVAPQYVTTSGRTISTTLPVTGTYTVFVNPRTNLTGSMTLRV